MAVGGVDLGVAVDVDQLDGAVAGLGVQPAAQGLHADLPIGGSQPRRAAPILRADGAVGSENAVHERRARDFDDEARPHVAAAVRRPRHADGNRIGTVVDSHFERVGGLLGGAVLGAADIHVGLVPAGNLDRPVEGLDRKPAAGFQGVGVVKVLTIPVKTTEILDIAGCQAEQGGCQDGKKELRSHSCPRLTGYASGVRIVPRKPRERPRTGVQSC